MFTVPGLRQTYSCILITKTDPRGLGALIAEKFAAEGCNLAINYVSNLERAKQTAEKIEREYSAKTVIIQGVGSIDRRGISLEESNVTVDTSCRIWVYLRTARKW